MTPGQEWAGEMHLESYAAGQLCFGEGGRERVGRCGRYKLRRVMGPDQSATNWTANCSRSVQESFRRICNFGATNLQSCLHAHVVALNRSATTGAVNAAERGKLLRAGVIYLFALLHEGNVIVKWETWSFRGIASGLTSQLWYQVLVVLTPFLAAGPAGKLL